MTEDKYKDALQRIVEMVNSYNGASDPLTAFYEMLKILHDIRDLASDTLSGIPTK